MCDKPDLEEQKSLALYAPLPPQELSTEFEIHSFEPSPLHFNIHHQFLNSNSTFNKTIALHWKAHRIAVADIDGQVYFESTDGEGSSIKSNSALTPNTQAAKLDTLAFENQLFGKDPMIDMLKIDAEGVDAKVVLGASRLLQENRIRVIMWETPNQGQFPLAFPESMGGPVRDFGHLIQMLDEYASMTCYFPGEKSRSIKLTGCYNHLLVYRCDGKFPITQSNAVCVHRTLAKPIYHVLEARALIYE